MKNMIAVALLATTLGTATVAPANAGCITGALIGGIAGHFIGGHGLVGAAAGCAGGAYLNHRQNQNQQLQNRPYQNGQDPRYNRQNPDNYNR